MTTAWIKVDIRGQHISLSIEKLKKCVQGRRDMDKRRRSSVNNKLNNEKNWSK
jgi:hypothetical protein